ncbi:TadE/TadG family type IV pilus assembly protein [Brucella sp. LJL56]
MKNWVTQVRRLAQHIFHCSPQLMGPNFIKDERGNFAMITALMLVPLLLAGMIAVDSANLMRVRNNVQASLDAAALAVGKKFSTGATQSDMQVYGTQVFTANLTALSMDAVQFQVTFPEGKQADQQIQATADFTYQSLFGVIASRLLGTERNDWDDKNYALRSAVRLKNTIEVALVLDNSGSMDYSGSGSNKKRMDLLKSAAKQLVETMAAQSSIVTRVQKPVQFSLVPFAGSVNVGPQYLNAPWVDTAGFNKVSFENFDLPVTIDNKRKIIEDPVGSKRFYKSGSGWGQDDGKPFSRTVLYNDISAKDATPWLKWGGCVEARSGKYALDVSAPVISNPATMFVPMFAPDEYYNSGRDRGLNYWWKENLSGSNYQKLQRDITKYYLKEKGARPDEKSGPNYSCTTSPLTLLTDVSQDEGKKAILDAIETMKSDGGTNVPEGLAWGWRTIAHAAPFTEGRPENERGNDKVVIVLTDGANTYYTYKSLLGSNGSDRAGNQSYYSAYGYTREVPAEYGHTRLFQETSVNEAQDNTVYGRAMNAKFATLCNNAKAANVIIMTVALDLSADKSDEKAQIDLLRSCSSDSRVRMESGKPAKLFWNSTGGDLAETFRQIGDELSNLRIVG